MNAGLESNRWIRIRREDLHKAIDVALVAGITVTVPASRVGRLIEVASTREQEKLYDLLSKA